MPKIKPLAHFIVATAIKPETKTKSGLLIPDSAQEKTQTATVIAVGNKVTNEVSLGDTILHSGVYDVREVKVEGEEYLIIKDEDILAVIK